MHEAVRCAVRGGGRTCAGCSAAHGAPMGAWQEERAAPRDGDAAREVCGSGCDLPDRDAALPRLVDEVVGDAGAGERDDALGQQVEQLVVAAERRGASVPVPFRFADDLMDAVALGPSGGDLLGAGSAAVHEDDIVVLELELVEGPYDGGCVPGLLAAGDRDQGSLRQVGAGLAVLARPLEVAASMAAEVRLPVWLVCDP